ncbi:sideroflexin-2-like isoform X1 [Aphis gossypii]|uniref:sideroflexin-2-like isoform X1 n=1 Tax=Aphis gossypii TaxID=80765 RepID=UPI00100EC666|nr:sideroflexin-2-like isoform X1 [Aphis gossypii]
METVKTVSCPWNLDTYFGRWMYYSWITNPKLNFVTSSMIEEAKLIRFSYLNGSISNDMTDTRLLYEHQIYENAIHPHTNEVQNIFGRLSFMPIGKAFLVAVLLTQLTKNSSSYVWHGLNQSYDSLVNFTNRNGDTKFIPTTQFRYGISVLAATVTSTLAAFHIERFLLSKICHPILYRFVPLITFAGGSFINVPIMRHQEIIEGVRIYDCNKEKVGYSKFAGLKGIGETIVTRIVMLAPGVVLIHYLENVLDNKSCWFRKNKWAHFPFKSIGFGIILIGMLPTACAIFPQFSSIQLCTLKRFDKEAYNQVTEKSTEHTDTLYFNKGL